MAKFDEIENYLKQKGVEYKVIDLPDTAVSVEDVVRLSGGQVKEEEIIKTLIVKTKTGDFVGRILQGKDRLKREVMDRLATKEEVLQIAGVEVGAVCPILLGIPMIIDKKVANLARVNMGSGDHLKGLEINLPDLLKVLDDFRIEEISL
ncbi:hypothetical protein A3A14_02110 [Candidatus Daviesbacteria bacterium RIFCSPLOWO2_01_FULL_43_38]|nr:MAG: hypothetical protein A2874_02870 [Candidatus Daviesbacteria bacterium RIFCSPHIGHO2_01_FULL_43_17]OGE36947.1 MAG: hypothetical protein A3E45_01750 [Candidatus Daviesbacteria bacterium RIFCSPHIGHO2_12_FULL_43_11]OGE63646.1 MAG: hypothetical protein A3A14_02110 [Candidatus Daviesbacteria bacterium RIFCSPLOWO2_01_FULL_43_38]OGE70526.1 MAG: hypothetical protein A3J21_00465 [Candidatus Daviesbacteria bacterium RIFCSPLOWO2_02_FULL_43_11]